MHFRDLLAKNKRNESGKNRMPSGAVKRFPAFIPSLLVSFISIIIICILIMGILSYHILGSFITDRTISSNNKLLGQFSSSMDSLILESVNDISMKMIYDINNNFYLNCYYTSSIENNLVDTYEVGRYLSNMSLFNPLIYSLSIYYKENNLLVCTDYIRHTLYKNDEEQEDLNHYCGIIAKHSKNSRDMSLIFDYGKNLKFKYPEYTGKKVPETVIHAVRNIYGYNKSVNGAVIVTISCDVFKNILEQYSAEDLGSILIVDSDGLIITHTNSRYTGRKISELEYGSMILNITDDSGHFITGVDGAPSVVSYQSSKNSDWKYISVSPIETVSSVGRFVLRTVETVGLLAIAVGLLVSLLVTKKLAKPIKSIASYCRKSPYSTENSNIRNEYSLISGTLNNLQNIMDEREKEIVKIEPILRLNFLGTILSDNAPGLEEIEVRMKMLGINMPYRFFCAVAVKLERLRGTGDDNVIKYEYDKLSVQSRLEETFTAGSCTCLVYEKDNVIAALLNFDLEMKELSELALKFLDSNCDDASVPKYLAFGQADEDILCMGLSFRMALNGLRYSFIFPEKHLYTYSETKVWDEKHLFPGRLLLNDFTNSLRSLNFGKCTADLGKIVAALREGSYSYQQIQTALYSCVSVVEDFICMQRGEVAADMDRDFKNRENIFEFEKWLAAIIRMAFDEMKNAGAGYNYLLVKKAREFVEQNIQNSQLSLEYVAKELGVSHKHLSRVFKIETGVTFVGYVTNLKLNCSRSLLMSTVMKVEEISEEMGYSSPQYFISRFRHVFGCTPREYRQKNSAQAQ